MNRRDRLIRGFLRYRLIVTTRDQTTWDGVVMDVDERTVILHSVSVVGKDGTRTPADGDVLLPRADIAYMQHVPEMQTGR